MEFLTGLSLRTWALIALVLAALTCYGVYEHTKSENVQLKVNNKTLTNTVAVQKDAIVTDQKLDKVAEDVQVHTQQAVKAVEVKHATIQAKVEAKEEAIEAKYDDTPITFQAVEQKQDELSAARIDSLWEAYCTAAPTATQCQSQQPQPQGDPHA